MQIRVYRQLHISCGKKNSIFDLELLKWHFFSKTGSKFYGMKISPGSIQTTPNLVKILADVGSTKKTFVAGGPEFMKKYFVAGGSRQTSNAE